MSGFGNKRKKYSWLPETNPAALSGDTSSPTSATKPEAGDSTPRQPKPRAKAGATSKTKKEKASSLSAERGDVHQMEGLGITTPGVELPAEKQDAEGTADTAENTENTKATEKAESSSVAVAETSKSVVTRPRRRSRKDSLDELVRSRLMSTMGAQNDSSNSQPTTPMLPMSGTPRGGRKRVVEAPTPGTITASVRDALASERSAAAGYPMSAQGTPKQRNTNGSRQLATAAGNSALGAPSASKAQGNGTPAIGAASARHASPQIRLGPLESRYSFPAYTSLGHRNITSAMRRGDRGVGSVDQIRGPEVTTGDNVIVIHPGSRWLRIGRASDPVPKEIPHVIARRLKARAQTVPVAASPKMDVGLAVDEDMDVDTSSDRNGDQNANDSAADVSAGDKPGQDGHKSALGAPGDDMEASEERPASGEDEASDGSDGSDEGNQSSDSGGGEDKEKDEVDLTLEMLRDVLKQHQRQSKRKVPPNVYSQVLTYNRQSRSETIQDHNDPFKIEWIQPAEIQGDFEIGERALRIADPDQFIIRHPLKNGCFNIEDYANVEDVLGDVESIWTSAIEKELGISRRDLPRFGVVLVVADIFSRVEVAALSDMLLQHMRFGHLLLQQSSALVTFGAGISTACVVDVGAQKTSIACIEDGFCYPESRVNVMYGGDDITRFLFNLFERSRFPYAEAALHRMYDWLMLNELREKYCTMKLSDVNIRLRDFFVRQPHQQHTRKYSFKTYDEAYHAPMCLFYPVVAGSLATLPDYSRSFVPADTSDPTLDLKQQTCAYVTPTQFGALPMRAIETPAVGSEEAAQQQQPSAEPATVPATEPGTPEHRPHHDAAANGASAPLAKDVSGDSATLPQTTAATTVVYETDPQAQFSRLPLDLAITHSIAHSGPIERARKLYSSILIVGGGVSFIPGFDELLASRLIYVRPDYMQGIERADVVSAPRDLDPRVLAWKGGAVLSRLECANEMWVSSRDWADFGTRLLRDRALFQW
ncbi:actin-like protein arp8 [Coemansia sp. RSA 1722]|nr:actin-like protein arp8 [Coemansia sp. RSA 485]KAJ2601065.1 actin-like protein arp8 [Coemansia sp. RSA 1722]